MTFWYIFRVLVAGTVYTILVTVACISAGLLIALASALLSRIQWKPVDSALGAFTYVFRGIPVLVLLFIVFFGLPG
jgi:polar amino acid transport system permease protein